MSVILKIRGGIFLRHRWYKKRKCRDYKYYNSKHVPESRKVNFTKKKWSMIDVTAII